MNVLYSAEQKGQSLASQALTDKRQRTEIKKKNELFDVVFDQETAILVLQKMKEKLKSLK